MQQRDEMEKAPGEWRRVVADASTVESESSSRHHTWSRLSGTAAAVAPTDNKPKKIFISIVPGFASAQGFYEHSSKV